MKSRSCLRGEGWVGVGEVGGGGECSRIQELKQEQRPWVGSTMVHSRTKKSVSIVMWVVSKC